ncbi:glycosyl transferase family 2 [Allomeiothermus silvanus DSM 9946]|uniref:Glycosyl transferase family 2 n=1 Tax=Allomeiothermus silvanus (strain ATCC 700542 / DSM 9946 / NBRC 106475 / NCIMB 13440 / VI-R2) TaxID=526227 RepID=D7BC91_ALLS1|nr:glycosyltransferase [Allomeiothermus silvanus]ADH64588.1 glycosyl transferase family 2 [Allomeiothermus silvanus DSM 9946]
MCRVALLIPVYNDQKGLEFSLSTLPTEIPLGVVVVDDGSQPPITLPELPFPHQGYLLRLEQNQGIEHALNHGLEWILTRGYEYVARLDAGDIALPGRFLAQLRFLEEHPDYALVGGQVRFVDLQGNTITKKRYHTVDADLRRSMHVRNSFPHPTVMMRARVLQEIGFYSDRYKAAEDYELFFRILKRFKVANLPDEVLIYRLNPNGISSRKRNMQLWSTLRVMLCHFNPRLIESYLGLFKCIFTFIFPKRIIAFVKKVLGDEVVEWL